MRPRGRHNLRIWYLLIVLLRVHTWVKAGSADSISMRVGCDRPQIREIKSARAIAAVCRAQ